MTTYNHRQTGFTLIEALIGLVVLAVGLLALANFQTSLLSSSGLSKARTEAVNIGQQAIEDQRNLILQTQYTALADTTTTVTGSNATFTVALNVTALPSAGSPTAADPDRTTIDVTVGWTDAQGDAQTVMLSSIVAWENPALGATVATEGAPSSSSIPQPQGGADLGEGKTYEDADLAAKSPVTSGNNDGIVTITNDEGKTELIDTNNDNEVMLTLNDDTSQFSTISGYIYIDSSSDATVTLNASSGVITSPGYALAPDAAYCTRVGLLNDNGTPLDDSDDYFELGSSGTYTYFAYHCYVASDWYGNIGILRIDNTNDEVCLGDPTVSGDTILATARMYRGFYKVVSSTLGTTPITYEVYPSTTQTIYYSDGIAGGIHLTDHHFFILNLTGNPSDSDCVAPMTTASAIVAGSNVFADNPNDYHCLKPEDDVSNSLGFNQQEMTAADEINAGGQKIAERECNPIKPGNRIDYATLTGTLNKHGNLTDIGATTVYAESFECAITSDVYTCTVAFAEGTTWSGDVLVAPDTGIEICDGTNPVSLAGVSDGTTYTNDFDLCLTSDRTEHAITGTIGDSLHASNPTVATSDGTDCTITSVLAGYSYDCTVSDFTGTPTSIGTGWSGDITLAVDSSYEVCSTNPLSFSNITADDSGNDFTVATVGNCSVPSTTQLTITGAVTVSGGNPTTFTGVTLTADSASGGSCIPSAGSTTVSSGGSTTYTCTTGAFSTSDTWTGVITVSTNKTVCINASETAITGVTSGDTITITGAASTPTIITHDIEIQKNGGSCSAGLN